MAFRREACYTLAKLPRFLLRYLDSKVVLAPGDYTIGRASECHFPLDDEQVSRQHAVLHVDTASIVVEDLGSRNGVLVNGELVQGTSALKHGDRLTFGNQTIYIMEEGERERRAMLSTVGGAADSAALQAELAKLRGQQPAPTAQVDLSTLSPREYEVLCLIARGYTYKEVANELDVSVKTVETYRARLGQKLDLKSRSEIVDFALRAGLLAGAPGDALKE